MGVLYRLQRIIYRTLEPEANFDGFHRERQEYAHRINNQFGKKLELEEFQVTTSNFESINWVHLDTKAPVHENIKTSENQLEQEGIKQSQTSSHLKLPPFELNNIPNEAKVPLTPRAFMTGAANSMKRVPHTSLLINQSSQRTTQDSPTLTCVTSTTNAGAARMRRLKRNRVLYSKLWKIILLATPLGIIISAICLVLAASQLDSSENRKYSKSIEKEENNYSVETDIGMWVHLIVNSFFQYYVCSGKSRNKMTTDDEAPLESSRRRPTPLSVPQRRVQSS